MTSMPPAGWYPDPENEGATRWWDGSQWGPAQQAAPEQDGPSGASSADSDADVPGQVPGTGYDPGEYNPAGTGYDPGEYGPASTAHDTTNPYASLQGQDSYQGQQPGAGWAGPTGSQAQGAGDAYGTYGSYDASGNAANPWTQSAPKSRTGLFVGLGAGALVVVVALVFLVVNLLSPSDGGGGGGGGTAEPTGDPATPTETPSSYPASFELEVPEDGEARQDFVIEEPGDYDISVDATNGEDPVATLEGQGGEVARDDDGGDRYNSLISESLEPGTFTLVVTEFGGDALRVRVTIEQTGSSSADPNSADPSEEPSEEPSDGPTGQGSGTVVDEFEADVPADGEFTQEIVIEEGGAYEISVVATNGADPVLDLESEDGETWNDDDGGEGFNSLLEAPLTPGTYTLTITEFHGDALTADVTVTQR
ncbi:DUF2510 domain-containing protein [Georgenia deserti]|uniref:DUF2510 domain-containing protein n=1 Tax=Georgenia deserti TaxID=2093781 RepID=A0ABW4L324_9MICO